MTNSQGESTLNEIAQDFQDDLETYGDQGANLLLRDINGNSVTDMVLSPGEVRIALIALRDYYQLHGNEGTDA